jgi:hypothetical protein
MCRAAGAGPDNPPRKGPADDPRINVIDDRNPDRYRRITHYGTGAGSRKVKV